MNHAEENLRLQNAIHDIDDLQDYDNSNRLLTSTLRRPTRTQSSVIDNRSSGLQPRSLSSNNLFKRFSLHFGRQDTELGNVNQPSIPGKIVYTYFINLY